MGDEHDDGLRRWMLAALGCVLEPQSAVYISTPITTGPRFVAWRREMASGLSPESPDYRSRRAEEVIAPNRADVSRVLKLVRDRFDDSVIDPTALEDVPGWEQFDYHRFWTETIRRYVHTVVFVDGWQYSSGCVLELAAAVAADARLRHEDLAPLDPYEAVSLIQDAISDVSRDDVLPLEPFHTALRTLQHDMKGLNRPVVTGPDET